MVPNELHIWQARLDDERWPLAERLPAAERDRASGMGAEVGRRWAAARWALRGALAGYLEEDPEAIELRADERGKPRLADPNASLRFNLSHSGELALMAVAWDREVGVDVEQIAPRRSLPALARRALSASDAERLEALPPDERLAAFHSAWTRREAIAKGFGVGLATALPDEPVTVLDLDVGAGFAAAVAVTGDVRTTVRRFAIGPDLTPVQAPQGGELRAPRP